MRRKDVDSRFREARFREELLRLRAREAVRDFELACAGIIIPPTYAANPWKRSKLLAEARRELAECRAMLDDLEREAGRR